ncbi:MAG: SRPBCC family protein [Herminiimonas sp.]|uniref:SRPBCC family protein n=1 Tax=Herminiimonas sp. TaxID=1926289 RepID=UPI00271FC12B|nr:SRPBCC family protein [Herminiimonas sp.]MDO9420130.1 SRPBCC family protein [Herminiimonas sp.]
MQFQHLIEINDPLNPLIDTLTRDQLWRGLVMRAEAPKLFIPWLDECDLLERQGNVLSRALRYNDLLIHDHVTFTPQEKVHYDVPAQEDIPASSLVVTIEEPQPGALFVRFSYESGFADDDMDAFYNEFRRSAYQEADIDTIRIIRQLAEEGRLELPI